jgi:hypothetical protein
MTDQPSLRTTWGGLLRIVIKAALLFALCNVIYAVAQPLPLLGRLSLYGWLLPYRERLPYSENPAASNSITTSQLNAMFAAHAVSRPKAADEFRVLLVGDSATWGWLLPADQTPAAYINAANAQLEDGRRVVAYNLGYPVMSLTKDLLLLDDAGRFAPDLIVWLVSLESFPADKQTYPPVVAQNRAAVLSLSERYRLDVDAAALSPDPAFPTIFHQRRELADLLRLQLYGFGWAAAGIDQAIPAEIPRRRSDFDDDGLLAFNVWDAPTTLTADDLALEVLEAGVANSSTPVIVVNEPMFISDGENSDQRYNSLYPRWAYDQYRALMVDAANAHGWVYYDWWDTIAPAEFTDSPVHLTPAGAAALAERILAVIGE